MIRNDFIGIFENVLTQEYCDTAIKHFELMKENGFIVNRQQNNEGNKTIKNDEMLFSVIDENGLRGKLYTEFTDTFWAKVYSPYVEEFPVVLECEGHNIFELKIQKTKIGGGYHVWHSENTTRKDCNRFMVITAYLNDVEEGGETEFLYQHLRVKPKAGTVVVCPAGFTHTHRGNPPISNDKYIITGWVEM